MILDAYLPNSIAYVHEIRKNYVIATIGRPEPRLKSCIEKAHPGIYPRGVNTDGREYFAVKEARYYLDNWRHALQVTPEYVEHLTKVMNDKYSL